MNIEEIERETFKYNGNEFHLKFEKETSVPNGCKYMFVPTIKIPKSKLKETINNSSFKDYLREVQLKGVSFVDTNIRKQKSDYNSCDECLGMPKEINGWKFRTKNSYIKGNRVALISDDCISIGTYIPAGARLFEKKISSIKEALEILKAK